MTYGYKELEDAYRALGVQPGGLIYVTSELFGVADYEERGSRALMDAHYRAMRACLGDNGTIVVATASTHLCNTDEVFDPHSTPGTESGAFSEYIRKLPGTLRSFHPFVSYAANGPRAAEITANVSRNCFGPESPEGRMVERDALHVSVGLAPNMSCSTVHHVEQIMAVPYRYTKEFLHSVLRDGAVRTEPFYMHVWYRETGIERDKNVKLFEILRQHMEIREIRIGRGAIHAYSMADFTTHACRAFADDIYIWCRSKPTSFPYRK